jgi:hypothetical protein
MCFGIFFARCVKLTTSTARNLLEILAPNIRSVYVLVYVFEVIENIAPL